MSNRKKGEQFALQIYHMHVRDEINKQLDSGCKFVAQFEKNDHDREHIIIFERTKDDKKTTGKTGSVPKR